MRDVYNVLFVLRDREGNPAATSVIMAATEENIEQDIIKEASLYVMNFTVLTVELNKLSDLSIMKIADVAKEKGLI